MDLFFMMPTTAFMTEKKKKIPPQHPSIKHIFTCIFNYVSMDGYM